MKALKRKAKVVSDAERKHICVACRVSFQYNSRLKYHIRQYHFNCIGLAPYADTQNVDAVWVEKVQNTDTLVGIKKVGSNQILIQKVKDDTIEPTNIKREVIDVRKRYPVRSGVEVECRVCRKSFEQRALSKHFAAQHALLVTKRCEACDTSFKRLFNCASHICPFIDNKSERRVYCYRTEYVIYERNVPAMYLNVPLVKFNVPPRNKNNYNNKVSRSPDSQNDG